ncbi:hypothetical protein EYF80_011657 [Liparis tanakae]|uniref:Uncharacterized protein n=1 Tax=Liparis tanakae TaxID=230148 RepID=A0A4Z2ILT0_9TELE|nr:hypothetical protein EYF80_011657 [Liparis tanakae]
MTTKRKKRMKKRTMTGSLRKLQLKAAQKRYKHILQSEMLSRRTVPGNGSTQPQACVRGTRAAESLNKAVQPATYPAIRRFMDKQWEYVRDPEYKEGVRSRSFSRWHELWIHFS